jgi:hypothetical protein
MRRGIFYFPLKIEQFSDLFKNIFFLGVVLVIGKPAKPRYSIQINVFKLKELFFTKRIIFKKLE